MKKELTLEEAESIVDNMYQKRWEECSVDDGNTIHMGNLDKLHYNELERASILLLRTELRLKRENQKYKEVIDKAIEKINYYKIYCKENKGFTEYTDIEIEAIEPVISKLEDILKEVSE